MTDALYALLDSADGVERFSASSRTASAWGPHLQHAGPVIGLLTRAMDRLGPRPDTRITRITTEILGAVAVSDVEVSARIDRPGKRIELLSAEMRQAGPDGALRPVARASAWRLRTSDTAAVVHHAEPSLPQPDGEFGQMGGLPEAFRQGFVLAVEWEMVDLGGPGSPTQVWTRLRHPLVAGEATTPLESMVSISDAANGIGARLDPRAWTFLNTETTIHLYAPPTGDLVGISAESSIGPDGIAMSSAVLHSATGPVGRVTQNSLLERVG